MQLRIPAHTDGRILRPALPEGTLDIPLASPTPLRHMVRYGHVRACMRDKVRVGRVYGHVWAWLHAAHSPQPCHPAPTAVPCHICTATHRCIPTSTPDLSIATHPVRGRARTIIIQLPTRDGPTLLTPTLIITTFVIPNLAVLPCPPKHFL